MSCLGLVPIPSFVAAKFGITKESSYELNSKSFKVAMLGNRFYISQSDLPILFAAVCKNWQEEASLVATVKNQRNEVIKELADALTKPAVDDWEQCLKNMEAEKQ